MEGNEGPRPAESSNFYFLAATLAATAALGLAFALALAGCTAAPPEQPPDIVPDGGERVFADTVIAFSSSGQLTTCADTLPACGSPPPAGPCGTNPALGAPDGMAFLLGPSDILEVAFRCSAILEQGSPDGNLSADFQIWSTVPAGAQAIVEVSLDGSSYQQLDILDAPDKTFDLARLGVPVVRFVRIAAAGQGGIAIDAVEAL